MQMLYTTIVVGAVTVIFGAIFIFLALKASGILGTTYDEMQQEDRDEYLAVLFGDRPGVQILDLEDEN